MLIYARNQTFCSNSVSKAPKMLIFGLNTLCGILSNYTWKNCRYQKLISYVFYCFMNFLMYFFVFLTFCFCCFFQWNLWQTLFEAPKNKLISAIESKNKHIYMNFVKKLNLHWFCTQNHIFEPFSVRRACTKSYVSSEPYPRASQIWCQNVRETWKKKVIKCRGESFARCKVIAQNVGGGGAF